MFLSFRQKPEDTGSIFGFSIYFSNSSWHLDLYMFTIVYSKGSYLRSTCDVLGNVQMLTCEHKKKFIVVLFKTSLLEIYMWCSWKCANAYLWTQKKKKVYCFPFLNFFTWDLHVMFLEIYKCLFVNIFFFTWDLHVMFLDLYRCLLVNIKRNFYWPV